VGKGTVSVNACFSCFALLGDMDGEFVNEEEVRGFDGGVGQTLGATLTGVALSSSRNGSVADGEDTTSMDCNAC
jgi:hypothetical protein